jgi:hypothetical protein
MEVEKKEICPPYVIIMMISACSNGLVGRREASWESAEYTETILRTICS